MNLFFMNTDWLGETICCNRPANRLVRTFVKVCTRLMGLKSFTFWVASCDESRVEGLHVSEFLSPDTRDGCHDINFDNGPT
jgi:hypothetical protein